MDKPVLTYSLQNDKYVLHQRFRPVRPPIEEVALCIDMTGDGLLMKYGDPAIVTQHGNELRHSLLALPGASEEIVVVSGKFPVKDLNYLIANPSKAGRFLAKHFPDGLLIQE